MTLVNMELTLPPGFQGLDWFWTEYREVWQQGKGKENLGVTLQSLISCIPSPAPVLYSPPGYSESTFVL